MLIKLCVLQNGIVTCNIAQFGPCQLFNLAQDELQAIMIWIGFIVKKLLDDLLNCDE